MEKDKKSKPHPFETILGGKWTNDKVGKTFILTKDKLKEPTRPAFVPDEALRSSDGRVWVNGGSPDDFFSAVRKEGVWAFGVPSVDDLADNFSSVKDLSEVSKLSKEARSSCSGKPVY